MTLTTSMKTANQSQDAQTAARPRTLCGLLEIQRKLVRQEELESLLLAERLWREAGRPVEPLDLRDLLEIVLRRCVSEGLTYAPVILLRKKSIDRGTWTPRTRGSKRRTQASPENSEPATVVAPIVAKMTNDGLTPSRFSMTESFPVVTPVGNACPKCGDSGMIALPGGLHGIMCPCGKLMKDLAARAASR